ncbi:MAG: YchJ family protein, partial [Silanimonas sp.]
TPALLPSGAPWPATAEALMRSRYEAFVRGDVEHLLATWHPSTRPAPETLAPEPGTRWLGLDVKRAVEDGDAATVEFVARFKVGGRPAVRLHEISRFVREDGRWLYVDGVLS